MFNKLLRHHALLVTIVAIISLLFGLYLYGFLNRQIIHVVTTHDLRGDVGKNFEAQFGFSGGFGDKYYEIVFEFEKKIPLGLSIRGYYAKPRSRIPAVPAKVVPLDTRTIMLIGASTAVLSGVPQEAGEYKFVVAAREGFAPFRMAAGKREFVLTIEDSQKASVR